MIISRLFALVLPSRVIFAAAILALLGYGQKTSAQSIDQLVSKGGTVHLGTAYQLTHTLIIPSNTRITCDAGGSLSDLPGLKLDSLLLIRGQGVSIEGCDIYSNSAHVIMVLGAQSSGVSLIHNHLHSFNHAHGILIDAPNIHGVVHAADLTDVSIDGNTFSNIWADAIELNNPVTNDCCGIRLTDVRASGVAIRHNKFRVPKHAGSSAGAGFCVGVAGAHDIDILDNDCIAWNAGVHVEDRAYNIKILGNLISTDDHEKNGEQAAIWINDGQNITLAQNKIKNTAGDGIFISYDATHQASNIEIAGNEITGCGRYGLFIAGGSLGPMNSRVHDNTVSGCAVPVFLAGKLKSLSFHSNRLGAKSGCVFQIAKDTNKVDIDMKSNTDPDSGGDANASCN